MQPVTQLPAGAHSSHKAPVDRENDFHSSSDEAIKELERRKVIDFVLPRVESDKPVFLGLPGAKWSCERQIEADDDRQWKFRGAESRWITMERSFGWMPRHNRKTFFRGTDKNGIVTAGTASSQIKHCWMSAILTHKHVPRQYRNIDSVWLDFTGPIGCEEVFACLRNLHRVARCATSIPIVITALQGRDVLPLPKASSTLERRVAAIESLCGDEWSTTDSWNYVSAVSTMIVACGELST